jgi:hypothetical protein
MSETLLAATTVGGNSDPISIGGTKSPASVHCGPILGAGETGTVQFRDGSGAWQALIVDGVAAVLTPTNTLIPLYGPAMFRVVLSVTAGSTGVYADYEGDIGTET